MTDNNPTIITIDQVRAAAAVLGITGMDSLREIHMSPSSVQIVRFVIGKDGYKVLKGDDVATTTTTVRLSHTPAETVSRLLREQAAEIRADTTTVKQSFWHTFWDAFTFTNRGAGAK